MNDTVEEEICHVLIKGNDPRRYGFFEKLEEKAMKCGVISIFYFSQTKMMIVGENGAVSEMIIWLASGSRLKKLCRLNKEHQGAS